MLKATIALERKVTGERTNTGAILFLYEFVPLAAPPRKIFPKLAEVSLLAGYRRVSCS